jgi:group I intron endonuclease
MFVYVITNLLDGKRYVGRTKNVRARWAQHKCDALTSQLPYRLHEAIRKDGVDAFNVHILFTGESMDAANHWEKFFISLYETMNPDHGYNYVEGGTMSGMKGRQQSPEARTKIRAARTGTHHSEETRKKLTNKSRTGMPHTEETKLKMAASRKAWWARKQQLEV